MNELYQSGFDVDGRMYYGHPEYALFDAVDQYSDKKAMFDSFNKEQAQEEMLIKDKYQQLTKEPKPVAGIAASSGNVYPDGKQRWRLPVPPRPVVNPVYAPDSQTEKGAYHPTMPKAFSFKKK